MESYEQKLERPYKSAKKRANIYGICFGFAQCVIFMAYAASFTYGGYLVSNEGLQYMFVFRLVPHLLWISILSGLQIAFVFWDFSDVAPELFQRWSSAAQPWEELPPSLLTTPKPKLPLLSFLNCWTEFPGLTWARLVEKNGCVHAEIKWNHAPCSSFCFCFLILNNHLSVVRRTSGAK